MDWALNCMGGNSGHIQAAGLFLFSVCSWLWCKMTCLLQVSALTFLLSETVICNHKPNKSFSPPNCFCQIISREQEQNEDSVHCIFTPRGQAASLSLSSWGSSPPNESPLAYGSSSGLADCSYHLWPRAVLMGTQPLSRHNCLKGEGGAERREGQGCWGNEGRSSYTAPEREITFLFSLCRTLLPGKAMNSVRLAPTASLGLDTAVHLTTTGSKKNKGSWLWL